MGRTSQDAVSHNHCNSLGVSSSGNSEHCQNNSEQQGFHDEWPVIQQPITGNQQVLTSSSNANGPFEHPNLHVTAVSLRRNCELDAAQVSQEEITSGNAISEKIESVSVSNNTGLGLHANFNLENTPTSNFLTSDDHHEENGYLWTRNSHGDTVFAHKGCDIDGGINNGEEDQAGSTYAVILPLLEGDFRAVLQGNDLNEIEICVESGCPNVEEFDGTHLVFVGAGSDPYEVITNAVKTIEKHLKTFCHRERKKMPDMLNWFGWCTWDAFYTDVTSENVKQGLRSFEEGGIPAKFVIIDDGWQSVSMDPNGIEWKADCAAK